jgi:hypothetical protein
MNRHARDRSTKNTCETLILVSGPTQEHVDPDLSDFVVPVQQAIVPGKGERHWDQVLLWMVGSDACLVSCLEYPTCPQAGSLKVLRAPVHRGGIQHASQTKIYNLETDEFVSNLPFSK